MADVGEGRLPHPRRAFSVSSPERRQAPGGDPLGESRSAPRTKQVGQVVLDPQAGRSAGSAPASSARSAARASAHEAGELGRRRRPGPAPAASVAGGRARAPSARPGPSGSGSSRQPVAVDDGGQRARPAAAAPAPRGRPRRRRAPRPARQRPAAPARAAASRSASAGGRLAEQQRRQLVATAPAQVLDLGLRLRVALDRVGGELVDVGEDRLGEQAELLGVQPGPAAGRRDPPPGDPGADPVGGLQRVERAPLAQLAAAEGDVDLAAHARGRRPDRGSARRTARSASPTPVRMPRPKLPSSGRAYSGTSRAIVARISAVIASSSGSISVGDPRRRGRARARCRQFLSSN